MATVGMACQYICIDTDHHSERFQGLAAAVDDADDDTTRRLRLAELADFLRHLPPGAFRRAVADSPRAAADPSLRNHGEIYIVGGAVMALAFAARPSTNDVDAVFTPKEIVRRAARQVARDADVDANWLNDAVKGFLGDRGEFSTWLDLPHLKVFTPVPEYLLAMKCIAFRLGPEFHDEADVRYLLRYLNIESARGALDVVERYFPSDRIPPKTRFALEELLTPGT